MVYLEIVMPLDLGVGNRFIWEINLLSRFNQGCTGVFPGLYSIQPEAKDDILQNYKHFLFLAYYSNRNMIKTIKKN